MKKYKKLYMHTIGGTPASFTGEQITYCSSRIKIPQELCKDLKQIRKEQELSNSWRKKQGFSPCDDYDYRIIHIYKVG